MAEFITNAAGQVIHRGNNDLSNVQIPRAAIPIPQHLPKFYIYAQEGVEGDQILNAAERIRAYGAATFDPLDKYFNMSTLFANTANRAGNICTYHRIVPSDAEFASIRIGLDLLAVDVDRYERDPVTGNFVLDNLGEPIPLAATVPVPGIEMAVVVKDIVDNFGTATSGVGGRGSGQDTSTFYPAMDYQFYSKTAVGNLVGISIEVPNYLTSSSMPEKLLSQEKAYPFIIKVYRKPTQTGAPVVVETLNGSQGLTFVLKPNTRDPDTGGRVSLKDTFVKAYQNLTDARYPKVNAPFNKIHVYDTEINQALVSMFAREVLYINDYDADITANQDSLYLLNPFTAKTVNGAPYEVIRMVASPGSVPISKNKIIYATGGSDGTMSQAAFNAAVKADLERYLDPEDEYNDIVLHPANYFYDCGFDYASQTKHALANVMAVRKDTVVYSCLIVEGEDRRTETQEGDRGLSLYGRFRDFPESEYFGTNCARVVIQGRDYTLFDDTYTKRVPVLLDLLRMNAEFMGASNGKWDSTKRPDGNPGNILTLGSDVNIPWIGPSQRARNWNSAINWVMPSDTGEMFLPHTKTIFDDDTSILTGHLSLAVLSMCNRIGRRIWTRFVGRQDLTGPQLINEVNNAAQEELNGIFGPEWIVRPRATITAQDAAYGYRWSLPIEIYGPNMPTVMTFWTETYRSSDFAA